jgi:AraC family transcriptional regulator
MFQVLTEENQHGLKLTKNGSCINYSVLKEFYCPAPFRSFSIKYVVSGDELYSVNGNKYLIKPKEFLLANTHSEGFVVVDSKNPVTGICIDVAPDILAEVLSYHFAPDTPVSDLNLGSFFNSPDFLENKYNAYKTKTGRFLLEVEKNLTAEQSSGTILNKEFYFRLAECIIADHIPVVKQLQSVKAVKRETRKDLFRRAMKGKDFIDAFFLQSLPVETIAREVALSEYHFIRLFKSIYNTSPHQYTIQKRLQFAKEKIQNDRAPLSSIALLAGFSDVHSFSKSFKKQFGIPPSRLF